MLMDASAIEQLGAKGDLTNWALGLLAIVCAAAFSYLTGTIKSKDSETKTANTEMVKIFREVIQKSDERHAQQVTEHVRDRDAFLENTGRITHAIEESTKTQGSIASSIANKLDNLTEELRRSNPSLRGQ